MHWKTQWIRHNHNHFYHFYNFYLFYNFFWSLLPEAAVQPPASSLLPESPTSGPADHPVSQVGGWTAGWRLREKASEKVVKVVKVIIFCQICYVLQGFLWVWASKSKFYLVKATILLRFLWKSYKKSGYWSRDIIVKYNRISTSITIFLDDFHWNLNKIVAFTK